MRTLTGSLAAALFIAVYALMNGSLLSFAHGPSLVAVLGVALALTLGTHGGAATLSGLQIAVRTGELDDGAGRRASDVLHTLHRGVLAGAGLAILVACGQLIQGIGDPASVGPLLSTAVVPAVVGVGVAELLLAPLSQSVASRSGRSCRVGSGSALVLAGAVVPVVGALSMMA